MFKLLIAVITGLSVIALTVLVNITTPSAIGPFGVLIVFAFAYMSSLGLMTYFIFVFNHLVARAYGLFMPRRPFAPLSFKRSYYFSTVLAVSPVMLICLQSVGAIGAYELALVFIFVVIGCLYVSKKVC